LTRNYLGSGPWVGSQVRSMRATFRLGPHRSRNGSQYLVHLGTQLFLACALFLAAAPAHAQSLKVYGDDFVHETWSYETLWEPALAAGVSVGWNDFVSPSKGYGPGWPGYGHHYVVSLADNVNGKFMRQFVFAAASGHEDNYSPKSGGVWRRVGNAALHTIWVCPGKSDWKLTAKTLNWSGIPASFATAAFSNAYQPGPQRNISSTFERAGIGTLGYAGGNVLTTFVDAVKDSHHKLHVFLRNRFSHTACPD